MTYQDMEKISKLRGIIIFKHFIAFLEIYGQENFGENVEINWPRVYDACNSFDLFDNNTELEEIVYAKNDEEFRDKMFSWIEMQILNGYPIWRLFDLNNWLSNQLEKELHEKEHKKDIEYFNNNKCLSCKYYKDNVEYIDRKTKLLYEYNSGEGDGIHKPPKYCKLFHNKNCGKRKELLEQRRRKDKYKYSWPEELENGFKFKPFNLNDETQEENDSSKWCLIPEKIKSCPYHTQDNEMTFEKFIKIYGEVLR